MDWYEILESSDGVNEKMKSRPTSEGKSGDEWENYGKKKKIKKLWKQGL